jgi:Cupin-like domain
MMLDFFNMSLMRFMGEHKYSVITEEFPDRDKFPLYYQASKHEYIIGPGEMLFIPAGWYHFVFSEDVDKENGLNVAFNYWYDPQNNWCPGQISQLLPHKKEHDIKNVDLWKLLRDEKLRCTRSELNGLFPSNRIFHKYPGKVWNEYMTFDELYRAKNDKYYLIQNETFSIKQYAPQYKTPLLLSAIWLNFGKARSSLHYDEYDNWLCQIHGTKRVLLFPHEERDLLYMMNPIPIEIFERVRLLSDAPAYFIALTMTDVNRNPLEIYTENINKYAMEKSRSPLPKFDPPTSFKTVFTKGLNWQCDECKYPLHVFVVLGGKGVIHFDGRGSFRVFKGKVIIFPAHFTFPYHVRGNLKLLVPE